MTLQRTGRLKPRSKKRIAEMPERLAVIAEVIARDGNVCKARDVVPEVQCWTPDDLLDPDEIVRRGQRPGGHLDASNVQMLCRAHHNWKDANPIDAARRGLRPWPRGEVIP